MEIMRRAKHTWRGYKHNEDILPKLKINQVVKKTQNDRKKSAQQVQRMDRDRLPSLIMTYQPRGKRNQGRTLKRLLDCYRDRNRSPCEINDDDESSPNPSAPVFQIQYSSVLSPVYT